MEIKATKLEILSGLGALLAISLFLTAPAVAQPSLNWVDNGGSVTLQIVPSGTGSIGAEIAVTFTDVIDAVILADAVSFDTAIPGANPFTGTDTTGLFTTNFASGEVFASFGSIVLTSAIPIDYLTLDYSANGTFSATSVITAEGGAIFNPSVPDLSVGIFEDCFGDADGDGDIDGDDLIAVQTNFGSINPPPGDSDCDGDVDGDDLIAVQTSFGNTVTSAANASAVPEPTSLVMLSCLAVIGIASCRI